MYSAEILQRKDKIERLLRFLIVLCNSNNKKNTDYGKEKESKENRGTS